MRIYSERPYQITAREAIFSEFTKVRATLCVAATGTGKTITFGFVAKHWPCDCGRILIVVHRDELLQQAKEKCEAICGEHVEIEQGDLKATRSGEESLFFPPARIVVASKDTLWRHYRLKSFFRDEFGLLIIDEAHRLVKRNKTYMNIVDYFGAAKVLGVTATPDRSDEIALGQTFDTVAYTYGIQDAIQDGYLVPIIQQYTTIEDYDLSQVEPLKRGGDLNQEQLERYMRQEKQLHGVAAACIKYSNTENRWGNSRQTLVFAASVAHAKLLTSILNRNHERYGTGRAVSVCDDGIERDERRDIVRQYRSGEARYLVNYGVFTEGFDAPETRVVVIARPTMSRALYEQMVGRGTRPCDELAGLLGSMETATERRAAILASSKPSVLIVDFVGNSCVHKLATCADALGGKFDEEVIEEANKIISFSKEKRGDAYKLLVKLRREKEAAELNKRRDILIGATLSERVISPFDLWDVSVDREPGWFRGKLPTEGQIACLRKCGIPDKVIETLSFHKASRLIDTIVTRREKGLCTYSQARLLIKFGRSPDVTFSEARDTLDELAAMGWPKPASAVTPPGY